MSKFRELPKRAWKQTPLAISVLALMISLSTCRETRLARQQYNPQPVVVERFDRSMSQLSLHSDYFVLHCRTILQIRNEGISNASLTNANVALTFGVTQGSGRWTNNSLSTPSGLENFGATISQPLSLDVAMYVNNPSNSIEEAAIGYQLFTLGVPELEQITNLAEQLIEVWNGLQGTIQTNANEGIAGRFAFEHLLMGLLRANSYSESNVIPPYVNNFSFSIAEGETKPLPLDLLILMYDPTNTIPSYPSLQVSYNLVFDNGFTERHTTECRDSNRLPGI